MKKTRAARVIQRCPHPTCVNHQPQVQVFYQRWGTYRVEHSHQPIQRYRCNECGKVFTHLDKSPIKYQHRPDLNSQIFKLLASGMTIRRTAKVLGCDRKTVDRKLRFLAKRARKAHRELLLESGYTTKEIHFDEMETYQETILKMLSISLAVCAESGIILAVKACRMPTHGHNASKAREKYGWDVDDRPATYQAVLGMASRVADREFCVVKTDKKRGYTTAVAQAISWAQHQPVQSRKTSGDDKDPIFWINHIAARIRADLARMRRSTWANTKSLDRLNDHLWLYVAWVNGYELK